MFENLEVTGDDIQEDVVQKVSGDIEEVTVECGEETLTLRGHITEILRSQGTSSGAVKMKTEDGRTHFISSLRNAPPGVDLNAPVPKGATFESVYQGKAAQELLPSEEASVEEEEKDPVQPTIDDALPQTDEVE